MSFAFLRSLLRALSLISFSVGLLILALSRRQTGLLLLSLPPQTQMIIYLLFGLSATLLFFSILLSGFATKSTIPKTYPNKFIRSTLATILASIIVMSGANQAIVITKQAQHNLGQDVIAVSGTGSMYPTFPKGTLPTQQERESEVVAQVAMKKYPHGLSVGPYKFLDYQLQIGDIVSFSNIKTFDLSQGSNANGFIKRLIALPGDTLELRGGIVYRNQVPQKEPYIARAQSTFGGTTIQECVNYQVPQGKAIVLGDNRKGSLDSRNELGFVDLKSIDHVLPYNQQDQFKSSWHNPENDLSHDAQITLDIPNYLEQLNQIRTIQKVPALKLNPTLSQSAQLRGQKILQFNDFSTDASISAYPIEKSLQDAGYRNVLWGETIIQGYYESDELIENQQSFPSTLEFLTNPDFDDIGIAQVQGEINSCPTQVIVVQFGGYKPPVYSSSMVQSWNMALTNLQSIQPDWQNLTTYPEFYEQNKSSIDRINEIIATRITRISSITNALNQNQWLTDQQNNWLEQDQQLSQEQNSLANQINNQN